LYRTFSNAVFRAGWSFVCIVSEDSNIVGSLRGKFSTLHLRHFDRLRGERHVGEGRAEVHRARPSTFGIGLFYIHGQASGQRLVTKGTRTEELAAFFESQAASDLRQQDLQITRVVRCISIFVEGRACQSGTNRIRDGRVPRRHRRSL